MRGPLQFARFAVACVSFLAAGGCAFLAPPHSDYRPIHQAAAACDSPQVSTIIQNDPKAVNLTEDGGRGPLHVAAARCCTNVMQLLLQAGAKLELKGKTGETPLHVAAQEGCIAGVKLLVEKGAQINARDNQGHTPLRRAVDYEQTEVAALLRGLGAKD
jgi:ankyrin repeat protein